MGISSMPVLVNGISEFENLDFLSGEGGAYVSYPFMPRWRVGSKLLLGYLRYYSCNLDAAVGVGGRNGFTMGTGASLDYMAQPNFGVHLLLDYDLNTSALSNNSRMMHTVTLAVSANIVF